MEAIQISKKKNTKNEAGKIPTNEERLAALEAAMLEQMGV